MKSIANYSRTKSFICKECGIPSPCRYTGKNIYCSRQCAGMDMKDARREQSKRPEVREKISKGWFSKGASASPENQFKKGHKPWHKGKTDVYTEEQLERITEANRKKATVCVDCHYFITFGHKRPEDSTWGTHNMNKGVIQ